MQNVTKKALRAELLAARLAIPATEKEQLDAALCHYIAAHPSFLSADALLAYLPVRGEPDLTALFSVAAARGIPVYLPHCKESEMRFLLFTDHAHLVPDRFGIAAPPEGAPEATPTAHTLCLAPGLAVAEDGTRLGYGGGFYDRFLPQFAGNTLFPLYRRFVLPALPRETHDFLIDPTSIITEKGGI